MIALLSVGETILELLCLSLIARAKFEQQAQLTLSLFSGRSSQLNSAQL